MNAKKRHEHLKDCLSNNELARLLDDAFAKWQPSAREKGSRRTAPRIPVREEKPLFVVSFAFDGREVYLNRPAPVVDLSVDGLGIELNEAVPVGAILCFAFAGDEGKRGYGVALAVRCVERSGSYRIGLTFAETAQSLEIDVLDNDGVTERTAQRGWRDSLDGIATMLERAHRHCVNRLSFRFRSLSSAPDSKITAVALGAGKWLSIAADALVTGLRLCSCRRRIIRKVEKTIYDRHATFTIEARLFRYHATLNIDGKTIQSFSGMMRDRLGGLISEDATPTLVHVFGGGFCAWANLRSGEVTDCGLDMSTTVRQEMLARANRQLPAKKAPRPIELPSTLRSATVIPSPHA